MAVVFFFAKNIMSLPTSMPSIEILPKSPEALAQRQYFYVGGHYVDVRQHSGACHNTQ